MPTTRPAGTPISGTAGPQAGPQHPQCLTNEPEGSPRLLGVKEAARVLDVSTRTLFTLTQAGEVRSVKIGASVKYSPAALAAFIRRREGRGDIDLTDLLIRLQGSRHEEAGRAFKFAAGVIADSDPSITPEKLLAFVLTHRLRGMGTPGGGDDEGWMTARLDRMASTGEAAKLVAALKRNFLGLMKETD